MNKPFTYISYLFIFVLLIGMASADLGTFRTNQCINIIVLANSSLINLTQVTANQNITYVINQPMTLLGGQTFNYTFCNTSVNGEYTYSWLNPNIDCSQGNCANTFEINAQGMVYTSTQGIVYFIMLFILIGIFIFAVFSFLRIQFNNPRNEYGELIGIDWKKYLKIGSLVLAYISLIGLFYFAWNITYGILQFTEMANWFYALFRVLVYAFIPFILITFIFVISRLFKDKKIFDDINRGLTSK